METSRAPALLNDLYQFTMAGAYLDAGIGERRAVFELCSRRPPHGGTFALACGIGPALDFIESLRFGPEEIGYLRSLGIFGEKLLSRLAAFRFSGDVEAVQEGTVVFPREPLLRVSAPILEAQVLETPLLNLIGFATLVATKAARVCAAAAPAEVMEFGCRRAQGPDGAITASRSAFIGGATSTSNLEAGRRFEIPVKGTMAHSYVMAFPSEIEAFRAFVQAMPGLAVLLIDTVNTIQSGLPNAIAVARELRGRGGRLAGVRLDSGDLAEIAVKVREGFDRAGFPEVKIFASGDLDEGSITSLVAARAPIDSYGVGTRLAASWGDPALTSIYKLVAVEEGAGPGRLKARRKWTDDPEKATLPGVKQVWRRIDGSGFARGDLLALEAEGDRPEIPLLEPTFRAGERLRPPEAIGAIQARAREDLEKIPLPHRRLSDPLPYPVTLSPGLERLCADLRRGHD